MIFKASEKDYNSLSSIIKEHKFENVYLYIDSIMYGFESKYVSTYLLEADKELFAIIYNYHNSLQILEVKRPTKELIQEVSDFIINNQINRVSGSYSLLLRVFQTYKKVYLFTPGVIMRYQYDPKYIFSNQTFFASMKDLDEIAQMIIDDQHLGNSYKISDLSLQLKLRFMNDGCEYLCIKKDGMIISQFATFAIADDCAILSGMVTRPAYRDKGYGSILVKELSTHVYKKGKMPILYCYEEEYKTWYLKLGYETIGETAKLEKI